MIPDELIGVMPVILSLILIEGLLSVDNALAIASMASALPEKDQKKALRYGIVGAYAFRGLCLALASWIIENPWLRVLGGGYLVYLMAAHLWSKRAESDTQRKTSPNFWLTVLRIEVMDLSLSVDNVVAAVALDRRLWVVITGVFIGILALRLVAGGCLKLIKIFPILGTTAFLLVGYVGVLVIADFALEHHNTAWAIPSYVRFGGIFTITVLSMAYDTIRKRSLERSVEAVEL